MTAEQLVVLRLRSEEYAISIAQVKEIIFFCSRIIVIISLKARDTFKLLGLMPEFQLRY